MQEILLLWWTETEINMVNFWMYLVEEGPLESVVDAILLGCYAVWIFG
jgi:hypothetical protein